MDNKKIKVNISGVCIREGNLTQASKVVAKVC